MPRRDDDDDDRDERAQQPRRRPPRDDDEDERDQRVREGQRRRPAPPPGRRPAREDDYDERGPDVRRPGGADKGSVFIPSNGMALAGYYCGFLAVICGLGGFVATLYVASTGNLQAIRTWAPILTFGVMMAGGGIFALLGIILGSVGLARSGERGGTGHAVVGLVLGAITLVGLLVLLLMGVLVASRG